MKYKAEEFNMNIVAIVGSLRKGSYNMQLAKTMQERYKNRMNITIADIRSLPYYDQDEELNLPQTVTAFKQSIATADGIIVITPEYNWSIPGVLKNALDWISRVDKVMIDKPVLPVGVTPGMLGTIRAQLHLREILSSPGVQGRVLSPAGNEVLINNAIQKFDAKEGRLVDEATLSFLDEVVSKFVQLIQQ